jgi:hypothetical protein
MGSAYPARMRDVAFTIEVVELGIGIEDVVSIYFRAFGLSLVTSAP